MVLLIHLIVNVNKVIMKILNKYVLNVIINVKLVKMMQKFVHLVLGIDFHYQIVHVLHFLLKFLILFGVQVINYIYNILSLLNS